MKLYKFRSLGSDAEFDRVKAILESGEFWCSHFWQLNDPMEGVYQFMAGQLGEEKIRRLYEEKSTRVLCSFSGRRAFANPLLWGYYGNGFKGVAIEIEVAKTKVKKVNYKEAVAQFRNGPSMVQRILTTKLSCWKHEDEYRYLRRAPSAGLHKIGRITGVYFGRPYQTIINAADAHQRPEVRDYARRARSLKEMAEGRGILCSGVDVKDGKVCRADLASGNAA